MSEVNITQTKNDYEILLKELNSCEEKWKQRLSYHIKSNDGADIHDCYLCTTIMYEIERVIQEANNKIAAQNRDNILKSVTTNNEWNNPPSNHIATLNGVAYKDNLTTAREKYGINEG